MQITVTCACSREMTARAIPKGSFRCGCGAGVRVQLQAQEEPGCSVPACDRAVERTEVAPLCGGHVKEMMLALFADTYATYPPGSWLGAVRDYRLRFGGEPEMPGWLADREAAPPVHPTNPNPTLHEPVVYFAVVGDQVKIGTTTNATERFMAMNLPPSAVIHVIPGTYDTEKSYHRRFAVERTPRTEWFELSPRLRDHIDGLIQRGEAVCPSMATRLWTRS